MVIPYLASAEWYGVWICRMIEGFDETVAASEATSATILKPRELCRTCIAAPGGTVLLSVPVAGGASAVKRGPAEALRISEHGDWPRIHLGALETAYSRTPFYPHLMPLLRDAVTGHGEMLRDFNLTLHRILCRFSGIDRISEFRTAVINADDRLIQTAGEAAGNLRGGLSLVDMTFRYGPHTIFALLDCYFKKGY